MKIPNIQMVEILHLVPCRKAGGSVDVGVSVDVDEYVGVDADV